MKDRAVDRDISDHKRQPNQKQQCDERNFPDARTS